MKRLTTSQASIRKSTQTKIKLCISLVLYTEIEEKSNSGDVVTQRILIFALLMAMLLICSLSCLPQEASAWQLVDHYMCKDVDQITNLPISPRTISFNHTDMRAISWLCIDVTGLTEIINVTWQWKDPSDVLYMQYNFSARGGSRWNLWAYILIKGYPPAEKRGVWHVGVYLNGRSFRNTKLFTETFTIEPISCNQPLYGFAWSTREIPRNCGKISGIGARRCT